MNVIVEPDSTTGWFTVPGVVLGALLTTGATWLQRRSGDRKGERREVGLASGELRAGAHSLILVVSGYGGSSVSPLEMMQIVTPHTERVQKAHLAAADA